MSTSDCKCIFLESLLNILDADIHQDIIAWADDGKSFIIHNVKEFSEKILPLFFKHRNFSSFHRQLNLYGFTKYKNADLSKSFKHSSFIKNRYDLISSIQKKKSSLPVMLKNATPISKYLIICNAIKVIAKKSEKIGVDLEAVTEKVDDLRKMNKLLIEGNSRSNVDVERAGQVLAYFANFISNKFEDLRCDLRSS